MTGTIINNSPIPRGMWLVAIVTCLASGLAAVWWVWWLAALPLVVAGGAVCILKPEWGLYLLILSLFSPYYILSEFNLMPADAILFLIVLGFWLSRAQDGKSGLVRTRLDVPAVLWLVAMALSILQSGVFDARLGWVNWFRHVQLLLLFYTLSSLASYSVSRRLAELLILVAVILGAANFFGFLQTGGTERVYGIARVHMNWLLSVTIVYLSARICFASSPLRAGIFTLAMFVAILGEVANQSRAAIAIAALGVILVLIMAGIWGRANHVPLPRRRAKRLILGGLGLVLLAVLVAGPMFAALYNRFIAVGNAATTLNYRYFLWKTALDMYLQNPVLGIGLGQVKVWHEMFPSMRLESIGVWTFGLGTHLSFLKYLAETGTIGVIVLLWFQGKVGWLGFRLFRRLKEPELAGHTIGVIGVVFAIILRFFVEGGFFFSISGIVTTLFFGFMMNLYLNPSGNNHHPQVPRFSP